MFAVKLSIMYFLSVTVNNNAMAAKVLAFYPCPAISHQLVFRKITNELLTRGHEVVVVTTDPMFSNGTTLTNLTEIDVHDVSYKVLNKYFSATVTGKNADVINQVKAVMNFIPILFEEQFNLQPVKDLLRYKKEEFDLLLLEAFFPPALGLTHVFEAPTILISSFSSFLGNYEALGAPTHPFIYNSLYRQRLHNLTFGEKINEVINQYMISNMFSNNEKIENKILQKIFGKDVPKLKSLRNNIDMLFLNVNPIWDGIRPVPPSVIYMGGLHQKPQEEIPQDLQDYLNMSKNGVIYFSLGTNVRTHLLSPDKVAVFYEVFSQLPYNVIWKWDDDNHPVKYKNIKMVKWVPQADLLRHPNMKLFITQGGLQSTDEAITAGVPLIGIPMLADQWANVEQYIFHGIGVRIDFENVTSNHFRSTIVEVAEGESYKRNVARLRSLLLDQPQTPLERAMWWIEYVLRHGGAKHLRAPAANITWTEFLELELVGLILFGTFVLMFIVIYIARIVYNSILFNVKRKKD